MGNLKALALFASMLALTGCASTRPRMPARAMSSPPSATAPPDSIVLIVILEDSGKAICVEPHLICGPDGKPIKGALLRMVECNEISNWGKASNQ